MQMQPATRRPFIGKGSIVRPLRALQCTYWCYVHRSYTMAACSSRLPVHATPQHAQHTTLWRVAWLATLARIDTHCNPLKHPGYPNWAIGLGILAVSGATYYYVLQKVGPNLNNQLEEEAARQEAAERRVSGK